MLLRDLIRITYRTPDTFEAIAAGYRLIGGNATQLGQDLIRSNGVGVSGAEVPVHPTPKFGVFHGAYSNADDRAR